MPQVHSLRPVVCLIGVLYSVALPKCLLCKLANRLRRRVMPMKSLFVTVSNCFQGFYFVRMCSPTCSDFHWMGSFKSCASFAAGDKIASTIVAQSARVPTLAWNGDGVTIPLPEDGTTQVLNRYRPTPFTLWRLWTPRNRYCAPKMWLACVALWASRTSLANDRLAWHILRLSFVADKSVCVVMVD
jgi:hypothetical protein